MGRQYRKASLSGQGPAEILADLKIMQILGTDNICS